MLTPFQFFAVGLVSGVLLQGLGLGLGWWCRHRPNAVPTEQPDSCAGTLRPTAAEPSRLNGAGTLRPAGAGKYFVHPRTALGCWLCGVLLLLAVAVHDHDPTLFAGQTLAAFAFWKMGWVQA